MKIQHKVLKRSIATNTLISLGIRISIVIILMTTITYYHVVKVITDESLEKLSKYVTERGESGRMIFKLAQDNHDRLKQKIIAQMNSPIPANVQQRFDRQFVRFPDGTIRTRKQGFNGEQQAGAFIGRNVKIDRDLQYRVLMFEQLANQYGPAWHHRFQNVYFTTPENLIVEYWPEIPDWAHQVQPDMYMPDEEWVSIASKEHNPERKSGWTGLFYDVVSKTWMVSLETPVDYQGRHVATIGHDILLNDLLQRTLDTHLKGSYNLIFRQDGRLITHPEKLESIKKAQGYYDINKSDDPKLKSLYKTVIENGNKQTIVQNPMNDAYLAVSFFEETGWYFVTVYPKALLQATAVSTSRIILLLGLVSLLTELLIFYFVLKRHIAYPLQKVMSAVNAMFNGNYKIRLNDSRPDELGQIGKVFNDMATEVEERTSELQQSEERLRTVIDATNDGVWDWNILTHEDYLSPNWKAILGYKDEELENIENTFFELIHPDDRHKVTDAVNRHFEKNEPYNIEIRMRHKDGSYRWILTRGEAIRDAEGKPVRMTGTISDVSERKNAEAALIANEARLRRAESIAHTGFYEFDADGNNFIGSDELKRIFGFDPDASCDLTDYVDRIHPDDKEKIMADLAEATRQMRGFEFEYRIVHPDGKLVYVHCMSEILPGNPGCPPRFFGALLDITDYKQAQQDIYKLSERLNLATRAAGIGIWDWDVRNKILEWDDRMFELYGIQSEQFHGTHEAWLTRLHPDDRQRCEATVQAALEGTAEYNINFRVNWPDGTEHYLKADGQVMRDSTGQAVRMIGTNYDITALKLAEEELIRHQNHLEELVSERTDELKASNVSLHASMQRLQQTQDQLVQSEKMASLGGLVAGIAHEINTPVGVGVTAISHFEMKLGDYLKRFEAGDLSRKDLASLLHLAQEASGMVHQNLIRAANLIRSFKQVAVDQTSNEIREFNLSQYLYEITQSLTPKLKRGGHRVDIDCPDDIVMYSHPGALSQVLTNLLMNSLIHAFTDDQSGLIRIQAKPGKKGRIVIDYSDDGKGIAPEHVKKIFEPFFTTARGKGGSGLGMHIVFNLVTQTLGGRIDCNSIAGQGVLFHIELAKACRNTANLGQVKSA